MIAIYARQSVEKKDSLSIQTQIDFCISKCEGQEFQIYQDSGFSGKNTDRPAFQTMLQDIGNGLISAIMVYRLDRIGRSISDFSKLLELLDNKNVRFVSVTQGLNTDGTTARTTINLFMVLAQSEREGIAERVRDNYYQRTSYGAWGGGPAPFGFNIGKTTNTFGKKASMLIPNEKTEIVRRIFNSYAAGESSLSKISKTLSVEGVPLSDRPAWDSVAVSRILHNPAYVMADADIYRYFKAKGVRITNPIEEFTGEYACQLIGKRDRGKNSVRPDDRRVLSIANHAGYISSAVWLQCQELLNNNRQITNTSQGKYTWLTGLIKCGGCGYALRVVPAKGALYLSCSGRTNLHICSRKALPILAEIEDAVEKEIVFIIGTCKANPDRQGQQGMNNQKKIQLTQLEEKIEKLVNSLSESSSTSMEYINKKISELHQQKEKLLRELTQKQKKRNTASYQDIKFQALDLSQRKLVAKKFIERILVHEDNIEIIWNI